MNDSNAKPSVKPEGNSTTQTDIEKYKADSANLGQLFEEYLNTNYVVSDGGVELTMRIHEKNSDLDDVFSKEGEKTGVFLTAYNPHSKELSRAENESRQAELISILKEKGYKFFYGYGEGDNVNWKPEPSFLIVGIDFQNSLDLAGKFEQNAFVYLEKGKPPILIKSS